jgi:hypothetical protein
MQVRVVPPLILIGEMGKLTMGFSQCARRSRKCEYPTMSRRGLHKRRDNGGGHHRESEDADYVPTT